MAYTFHASIYKAGINPCVDVPGKITGKLQPQKDFKLPQLSQIEGSAGAQCAEGDSTIGAIKITN